MLAKQGSAIHEYKS